MTKTIKTFIFSLSLLFGLVTLLPAPASAQLFKESKEAACKGVQSADCSGGESELNSAITNIVNLLSIVVGIAAVVIIIIGGFRYITSAGDANSISSAKHTILYALVGLVIAAMAQVIVRFVLTKV